MCEAFFLYNSPIAIGKDPCLTTRWCAVADLG